MIFVKILVFCAILICTNFFIANGQWKQTNGPKGVFRFSSIAFIDGYIYAGTGGVADVFRTSDEGKSWETLNQGLDDVLQVYAIEEINNDIFIGTGGSGVLKYSKSEGRWVKMNEGLENLHIRNIQKHKNGIFVGGILHYSSDNGVNWEVKSFGENKSNSVQALTSNDKYIFAGQTSGTSPFGIVPGNIFRSSDEGNTWEECTNGITNINIRTLASKGDTIFAGTDTGLFISYNNGDNWSFASVSQQEPSINKIRIDRDKVIISAFSGLFISHNYGDEWNKISSNLGNFETFDGLFIDDNTMICSVMGGLKWSKFDVLDWISIDENIVRSVIIELSSSKEYLYASALSNGLFRSNNKGESWEKINSERSLLSIDINDSLIVGKEYIWGPLFKSFDGGFTFNRIDLPHHSIIWASKLIGGNLVTCLNDGIYLSNDVGVNWEKVSDSLPNSLYLGHEVLYAVNTSAYPKLFLNSFDYGRTWSKIESIDSLERVKSFHANGKYVSLIASDSLFYLSEDYGKTWNSFPSELPQMDATIILITQDFMIATLYSKGLLLSRDKGLTWQPMNDGLTNVYISADLQMQDEYIFAALSGAGVFKAKLSDFGLINSYHERAVETSNLFANPPFPLPALNEVRTLLNWDTNIVLDESNVTVYNTYGSKMSTYGKIRLNYLSNSSGFLAWDCSDVESGIYFIHINYGTENKIIKAIVAK